MYCIMICASDQRLKHLPGEQSVQSPITVSAKQAGNLQIPLNIVGADYFMNTNMQYSTTKG